MNRDKTLDVAMRAYWRSDPGDVSVNAICSAAEVSKPSLYRVFGSEDGLMRAALERYGETVLSEIFVILARAAPVAQTLDALIAFASRDPKMETGCLFFKMRAGKHRLGPLTRAKVDEIEAGAIVALAAYLDDRRAGGEATGDGPSALAARYLFEQIGLALMQRAAGEDSDQIEATLRMALSVLQPR
ncbi:MAG: TetR/AcrR family transcriptional regulator [Pseudomonadota bacterium]